MARGALKARSAAAKLASGAATPVGALSGPEPSTVRKQILDTAASLLRRRGYEATTVRGIAGAVGIKAASIYHHFPSKDAIVEEVVNEGVRVVLHAVVAALSVLPADATPRDRLESAIRTHLVSSLEHGDYTSASIRAFAFLPDAIRAKCRTERRSYEDVWRAIIEDAKVRGYVGPGVSLDALRLLVLGAVNWAGEWYRPGGVGVDELARQFAGIVLGSRAGSSLADDSA